MEEADDMVSGKIVMQPDLAPNIRSYGKLLPVFIVQISLHGAGMVVGMDEVGHVAVVLHELTNRQQANEAKVKQDGRGFYPMRTLTLSYLEIDSHPMIAVQARRRSAGSKDCSQLRRITRNF